MARTTVHKIVSDVAVDVDALLRCVRMNDPSARRTRAEARANVVSHAQAEQSGDLAKPCEMLSAHSPSKILCIVQVS
jgi:hypothetical protein